MSEITVEVVEDTTRALGGHAVIRLNGLWLLPANASIRIEPLESPDGEGKRPDWPLGDVKPVETRLTVKGVEIVVGPDVVDSPYLLPGTPVSISVPSAFAGGDVLWPDLPVSEVPRAAPVVLTAAELAAELDADAAAKRKREDLEALALSQLKASMNGATSHGHDTPDGKDLSQLRRNGHDPDGLSPGQAGARTPLDAAPVMPNLDEESGGSMMGGRGVGVAPGVTGSARTLSGTDTAMAARASDTRAADAMPPPAATGTALSMPGQRAVVPMPKAAPAPGRKLGIMVPFALGFVVAGALTGLVALRQGSSEPAVSVASGPAAVSLDGALAVAAVSPRGRRAADVDLQGALKLADEALHQPQADREEAAYWLRRSVTLSLGTRQMTWAMTQLGTIYAQPAASVAPDYGKARLLWETAGGLGDATALCFLGSLYEFGLGVAASREQALSAYTRAKGLGGCKEIDTAIARVRK